MRILKSASILAVLSALSVSQLSLADGTMSSISHIKPLQGSQCVAGNVTIKGVVSLATPDRLNGFFIQQTSGTNNQGVFVEGNTGFTKLASGDTVEINAWRSCHSSALQLKQLNVLDHNADIQPVTIPASVQLQSLAPWEGMLVKFDANDDLVINSNYSYNYGSRRARVELSRGAPIIRPTQRFPAGSPEAVEQQTENDANRIMLVSDLKKQKGGEFAYFPEQNPNTNYMRVGDKVKSLVAVVAKERGRFVLIPTKPISSADLIRENRRSDTPAVSGQGDLRIASFNVLNYFNTAQWFAANNPTGQNRGADSRAFFALQTVKIVNAIVAMDADAIGLLEVENNGFDKHSAIHHLVSEINKQLPEVKHYAYASPKAADRIGGDAITTGLIYRPAVLTPEGGLKMIVMPDQRYTVKVEYSRPPRDYKASLGKASARPTVRTAEHNGHPRMRNSIVQTFVHKQSGERLTVVVNHLKSKGSKCLEDLQPYKDSHGRVRMTQWGYTVGAPSGEVDVQGSCNNFRVAAANVLGQYLQTHASELSKKLLVLGDMNAYAMEDPIRLLTSVKLDQYPVTTSVQTHLNGQPLSSKTMTEGYGFTNLVTLFHDNSYSYLYAGELGTLDYALANPALVPYVVDTYDWNINSIESELFEYGHKNSGDIEKNASPFRSSDHDPVIIELNMKAPHGNPKQVTCKAP